MAPVPKGARQVFTKHLTVQAIDLVLVFVFHRQEFDRGLLPVFTPDRYCWATSRRFRVDGGVSSALWHHSPYSSALVLVCVLSPLDCHDLMQTSGHPLKRPNKGR